jgi:hypothetical protein
MNLKTGLLARLRQRLDKILPVHIRFKNLKGVIKGSVNDIVIFPIAVARLIIFIPKPPAPSFAPRRSASRLLTQFRLIANRKSRLAQPRDLIAPPATSKEYDNLIN